MIENKFRAWSFLERKWVEAGQQLLGLLLAWESDRVFKVLGRGEYKILRFTGIQDKKGKEVYEDYVVKYTPIIYTDCGRSEIERQLDPILGTIYYAEGLWLGIKFQDGTGRLFHPGQFSSDEPNEELEILGNIYENPGLLGSDSNE
jgi:uncharacterized phage protein (TIGR01671 family)